MKPVIAVTDRFLKLKDKTENEFNYCVSKFSFFKLIFLKIRQKNCKHFSSLRFTLICFVCVTGDALRARKRYKQTIPALFDWSSMLF